MKYHYQIFNNSPLHYAVEKGSLFIVDLLLNKDNIEINFQNNNF